MDTEISRLIFSKARDRYDSAMRIAFLAILALIIFHLTTFQPFIDATARLSRVKIKNEMLKGVQRKLILIHSDLKQLEKQTHNIIRDALYRTLVSKVAAFQQLDMMVTAIRSGEVGDLPTVIGRPDMPQMQLPDDSIQMQVQRPLQRDDLSVQVPLDAGPRFSQLPAIEDTLADRIKQADSIEELRSLLLSYVRQNIIEVHFAELSNDLQAKAPALKEYAIAIRDSSVHFAKMHPSHAAYFKKLAQGMDEFVYAFNTLSIQPPENDHWWTSVQSKLVTMDALGEGAEQSLAQHLNRELSEQLENDLRWAVQQNDTAKAKIDIEIKALEKQFHSQQAQIQNFGSFMKWGVLNLKPVTAKFPLLLAFILAALSLMLSRRIHELALTITMMRDEQKELQHWLRRRVDGIGGRVLFDRLPAKEYILAGAGLLWVAIASWQVAGWEEVGAIGAIVMFVISVPVIGFAGWYQRRVAQGITGQK